MPENDTRTPSEIMLPTPFIEEVTQSHEVRESARQQQLDNLNSELDLMRQGVDQRDLAVGSLIVKHVESSREIVTDPLTGLLNRKGLDMWYDRYRPEVFAVFFADGRKFKPINDTYGHDTGDQALQEIGAKISEKFRIGKPSDKQAEQRRNPNSKDAMAVCRWSGDEFVMVIDLTGVPEDEYEEKIEMFKDRLSDFGSIKDERTGDDVPIHIDSVATIGYKKDGKSLNDYRSMLDTELNILKNSRGRTR